MLFVDDVLATGGTVAATVRLVEKAGAVAVGASVLMDLASSRAGTPSATCRSRAC